VAGDTTLSLTDKKLIRILQEDLPLCSEPYGEIAESLGIEHAEVIEKIGRWVEQGVVRRFGATLYHQRVGYKANCMVVWKVDDPELSRQEGEILAGFPQVTHCYRRPPFENWPYTLYTMIHGSSTGEIDKIVSKMSAASGLTDYCKLKSVKEWKKTSMKYFSEKESD